MTVDPSEEGTAAEPVEEQPAEETETVEVTDVEELPGGAVRLTGTLDLRDWQ